MTAIIVSLWLVAYPNYWGPLCNMSNPCGRCVATYGNPWCIPQQHPKKHQHGG